MRIFGRDIVTKAANAEDPNPSTAARRRFSGSGLYTVSWGVPTRSEWTTERAITQGLQRSIWAYKAVDTIAKDIAGLGIDIRKGDPSVNDLVPPEDAPLLWNRLNIKSNANEYAFTFKQRLIMQLLLSKRGAFIEYGQRSDGEIDWLYLLNPDSTAPIPHPTKFVEGFEVYVNGVPERVQNNVLWVKFPHPLDPYASLTPLEAAGLSVEIDYFSRSYNRNFMANDGRPAGLLTIKGGLPEDDAEVIKARFSGRAEPGKVTVIEAEDAAFQDLSTSPRDAAYAEGRKSSMEDILGAFGVPKSRTGDASGVSQDQSEAEEYAYWQSTNLPIIRLLDLAFGSLTPGGDNDDLLVRHNTSTIRALQRPVREDQQRMIERWRDGLATMNDVLVAMGHAAVDMPGFNTYFIAAGKVAVPGPDEADPEAVKALAVVPAAPAAPGAPGDDQTPRLPGSPGAARLSAILGRSPSLMPGQAPPRQFGAPALPAPASVDTGRAVSPETTAGYNADEASRVQQRRDAQRVGKAIFDASPETKADGDYKWNMTSLDLPVPAATALFRASPIPTTAPDEAHITLTLSDGAPMNQVTLDVVRAWAERTPPISVTIGPDLTTFPKGSDGVPVIYPVRSPTLEAARADLRDSLVQAGLNITEHPDYAPHVTVNYMPTEPASLEATKPVVIAHTFDGVAVHAADEGTSFFPFGGSDGAS